MAPIDRWIRGKKQTLNIPLSMVELLITLDVSI
jgi:hypothetical protein